MAETSFPLVGADLTDPAWAQTVGAVGSGIIDDWGNPYAITINTNDTVTIRPSTTSGAARAVVNGFGHSMDAAVTLPIPAVSAKTQYNIGLLYDPANAAQPVSLVVLKGTTVPLTTGQKFLPFYVFVRYSGQTLAAATLFSPKPRLRNTLYMGSDTDLQQISPLLFLYCTEVVLPGKTYLAKGSTTNPTWELQTATSTTGTVAAASGFKIVSDTLLSREDDVVELYIHATGAFPHTYQKFATVPAGFRPAQAVRAAVLLSGQDFPEPGGISVGTDGSLNFYGGAATSKHNDLAGFVKFKAA
jgi:hypothetical protein